MLAKFDEVTGACLVGLLLFVHSKKNRLVLKNGEEHKVVCVKAVNPDNPDNRSGETSYGVTLDILDWFPYEVGPTRNPVDRKYLTKVHGIIYPKPA
ncbi:MAG: hypothetical protein NTZ87_01085 [Candidatus Nomurabacteria bacterium]|nr:hypothetical protein [Candidatus Nomurabacteria bacterium]